MNRYRTIVLATSIAAAMLPLAGLATAGEGDEPVLASFEGRTINLANGWGDAKACASDGHATRCYRSEAAMDAAEPAAGDLRIGGTLATCSSSLRLYSSTGWNGSVLALTSRDVVINLSGYGFSNVTSSYKVGACSSIFYDGVGGGGSVYPGNTSAGASATSMLSGWDNRVSSVYIN